MTEKRYELKCHEINSWYIEKDGKVLIFDLFKSDAEILYTELNSLSDENEQLKQEYNKLKHRHSLLHDVCVEAECDRDRYHKDVLSLEKENEQLKQEGANVERLIDDLGSEELRRQYEEIINGDNDD